MFEPNHMIFQWKESGTEVGVFYLLIRTIRSKRKAVNIHLEALKTVGSCLGNKSTCGHVEVQEASLDGRRWSWGYTFKKDGN